MTISLKTIVMACLALIAGYLGGVALSGELALAPAPPSTNDPATAPGASAQDPLADCDLPDPSVHLLALQLHVQRERLRGLQATEHELLGDPVPFDEELDPKWHPDAIRSAAARAFESEDSRNVVIDCEEFPCMIAANYDPKSSSSTWSPSDAMREQGYLGTKRGIRIFGGKTGRSISIFAPDITLDERANRRLRLRSQALMTSWLDE